MGLLITLVFFGLIEGLLRLCGLPEGTFRGAFATSTGLWRPSESVIIKTGAVPYRVRANSYGFRGPEFRTGLAAAKQRVVAIGDSVTDGFFVDNHATYPVQLGQELLQRGLDVEVINAARGGGSIDRFHSILRDVAVHLAPDVVLVTFVTNDIVEVGSYKLPRGIGGALSTSLPGWFLGNTAIGEGLMDLYLRAGSTRYTEQHGAESSRRPLDNDRYLIAGGTSYQENALTFLKRYKGTDGMILQDRFIPVVQASFDRYLGHIDQFYATCRAHGIEMLFLYMPAYPQVYLPDTSMRARDLIQARVERLGGKFLDLTPAFRAAPKELGPLHLAPLDYHPNPSGYAVMARAIAARLIDAGMVQR